MDEIFSVFERTVRSVIVGPPARPERRGASLSDGSGWLDDGRLVSALDLFVHFRAMNGDGTRRFDAELNGVAIDADDNDADVVADHDRLVEFSTEYEQWIALRGNA